MLVVVASGGVRIKIHIVVLVRRVVTTSVNVLVVHCIRGVPARWFVRLRLDSPGAVVCLVRYFC